METKISIDANALCRYQDGDALRAVDEILGPAEAWSPSLIEYRLSSDFQADWKREVGCWLLAAKEYGFLDRIKNRIGRARNEAARPEVTGPNDSAHKILGQELAGPMVAYYFTSLGWKFESWDPPARGEGDVDLRLQSPAGVLADIQVKAPDQPGHVSGGQIVDGEHDAWVLNALDKGLGQIASQPGPIRMVVISPQRTFNIGADVLATYLVGKPRSIGDSLWGVSRDGGGKFTKDPGAAVSAVVDLSLLRGMGETLYRCTVICNPWMLSAGRLAPEGFSHARVLSLAGDKFIWTPEEPGRCFGFRSGTPYLENGGGV
jgi:hypothetical protein